ncbi:hypothetical protein BC938DRAFT_481576 [Jimgerdemannia flammicorona]|uniref:Uncharacterized protein n=1 Tax=Jimgerdemannia flammicorona TaxID=994334 RepID=A0A433QFY2_9FUNG|nr:hypothetical protein BC938DRAFT_481576 [Jimgerdemannia flammicorona]
MDRRLRELLEVYSTGAGSEQCGSPYLSLASSGCHSSTAVQAVLPVDVFGRSKDAASSTTLNHSLVKRASPRIPKANEQREGVSTTPSYHRDMLLVSRPPNRRAKSYDKAYASRDDCRPTIQPRGGVEKIKSSNCVGYSHYKAVDPISLRVTAALPPIPSSYVSPAIQDTEVASTDDNSLDAKVASTDVNSLDTEVVSTDDDSQDAEVTTAGVPSSVLLSRIGLRDDKRNVAKPTLRSGKSIAVRNEPEQANTWDTTK